MRIQSWNRQPTNATPPHKRVHGRARGHGARPARGWGRASAPTWVTAPAWPIWCNHDLDLDRVALHEVRPAPVGAPERPSDPPAAGATGLSLVLIIESSAQMQTRLGTQSQGRRRRGTYRSISTAAMPSLCCSARPSRRGRSSRFARSPSLCASPRCARRSEGGAACSTYRSARATAATRKKPRQLS